jgi:hypothetical protein
MDAAAKDAECTARKEGAQQIQLVIPKANVR